MFKLKIHVGVGMNSKEREEVLDRYKHITRGKERGYIDASQENNYGT